MLMPVASMAEPWTSVFVLVADTFLEVFVFPTFISCGQGSVASWCAPFGTS